MDRWRATIQVWPHSSGKGGEADQKAAGERVQTIEFTASGIDDAIAKVKLYQRGVEANPMVWQAPIYKIERT